MNLITALKRMWNAPPPAPEAPPPEAAPQAKTPIAESRRPTAPALDTRHITPDMQRLVGEIGAELAASLVSTIGLAMEMRHRRDAMGTPAIDAVAIAAWQTLAMLAGRVRANRPALMERDEPQLVEAVITWCALHLRIVAPVQLRELV